jgi:prophage regulatory protein
MFNKEGLTVMKNDVTNDRLIRIGEVINRTGLGRTSIYVMAKRGDFPRPVKLGPRASAWSTAAINSWIEARKLQSAVAA